MGSYIVTKISIFEGCHGKHSQKVWFYLFFFLNLLILNFKMTTSIFCEDCHREYLEKVWLKMNYNCVLILVKTLIRH